MSERQTAKIPVWKTSTDTLRPRDRLPYWRQQLADYHDVGLAEGTREDSFEVHNSLWNLGSVIVVDARFGAHSQLRDLQKIRRGGADHYEIDLCLSGAATRFRSNQEDRLVRPGDLILKDLGQQEESRYPDSNHVVTVIARDFLDDLLTSSPNVHGLMPTGPLAALLSDHLRNMVTCLRASPASAAPLLAQATAAMVAAVVNSTPDTLKAARPHIHTALRRRIVAYIDQELENPNLSPDHLCSVFHLSRASLYRIFDQSGGIASCIRMRRLARIRAIIETGEFSHLGSLADRFAFSSQSQLSRAFRSLYGHAPTDTRPRHRQDAPVSENTQGLVFSRWMQDLGRPA